MVINRPKYLKQLVSSINNGFPKVITGIRRCGKSYLLKEIFASYLKERGTDESKIIVLELDDTMNYQYRNPLKLTEFIKSKITEPGENYFVFIDEIQLVTTILNPEFTEGKIVRAKPDDIDVISFVDVVLGLSRIKNVDLYVTGSNSKLLSKDVVTEFRDKATNIHIQPLSFEEFNSYFDGDEQTSFYEYLRHGGMPLAVLSEYDGKEKYLKDLFSMTYFKDILEHHKFKKTETLDDVCNCISSQSGQYLNTTKIANTITSVKREKVDPETIGKYIEAFEDSYMISSVERYDIKGNKNIGATRKYYFCDTGLRNARLNFMSLDTGQLLEMAVYNELVYHGYNVKVGTFNQVEKDATGKSVSKEYEVDFLASRGSDTIYIQVADNIESENTKTREIRPFKLIKDSFQKIIVVNRPMKAMRLEGGIILIGITEFLLEFLK